MTRFTTIHDLTAAIAEHLACMGVDVDADADVDEIEQAVRENRTARYEDHSDPAVLAALLRRVWADVTDGAEWPHPEPLAVTSVDNVGPSTCTDHEGAVDADVTLGDGSEYGVTLVPSRYNGELGAWGDTDHWIAGPTPDALPAAVLDAIVAAVRDAAEREGLAS